MFAIAMFGGKLSKQNKANFCIFKQYAVISKSGLLTLEVCLNNLSFVPLP